MRISELAETTGVPVHTLKYYLREGLLMPGEATSRTRAEYGAQHVERVRLVRALVEHGGVGIAGVRAILDALAAPPPSRHELLGVAHAALPGTSRDDGTADVDPSVRRFVERLDLGRRADRAPAIGRLADAVVQPPEPPGFPCPTRTSRATRRRCAASPRSTSR